MPDATTPPSDIAGSTGAAARVGLWLGPVLAAASLLLPLTGLAWEARLVLALLVLMATWWITEALPLAATALIPIIAVPLIGIDVGMDGRGRLVCATEGFCHDALAGPLANERVLNLGDLGAHYSNPVVLLYIGGFLLGIAIERWGLSTRIAYGLVARGGARPGLMLAGFIAAAGFISMWISNTSTSLILTPLALSVAAGSAVKGKEDPKFAAALVLAVAYAATIGGLATPIGTPATSHSCRIQPSAICERHELCMQRNITLSVLPRPHASTSDSPASDMCTVAFTFNCPLGKTHNHREC